MAIEFGTSEQTNGKSSGNWKDPWIWTRPSNLLVLDVVASWVMTLFFSDDIDIFCGFVELSDQETDKQVTQVLGNPGENMCFCV